MPYQSFEDFSVYQKGLKLLLNIYQRTKTYPIDERYVLVSDTNRSANSVVHNIAEGYGRFEARDKTRFYKISRGSAYEIISQIIVGNALGYLDDSTKSELQSGYENVIEELDRLIKTLERKRS